MEGRLVLHCEVRSTEAVQRLRWSNSNDGHAGHSAHIFDPFRKLRSFRKWNKGTDIDPEDETSYTTQYQEAFLQYVENEYCAKHRHVPVNKLESLPRSYLLPSATASGSCESYFDPFDLSSDDEDYLMPNIVAKTTPR